MKAPNVRISGSAPWSLVRYVLCACGRGSRWHAVPVVRAAALYVLVEYPYPSAAAMCLKIEKFLAPVVRDDVGLRIVRTALNLNDLNADVVEPVDTQDLKS